MMTRIPAGIRALAVGLGLGVAPGCTDLSAPPDDFRLPEADASLDPDRLSVGDYIATPCAFGIWGDGLAHLRERHEGALVDIYFGRGSPEGPWEGPTASDIALVRSHGGTVLYGFNIPAVRARIVLSRIPDLVREGFWITVRDVPDATRYDVPLSVGFTRPLRDEDVALFESLGGRVTSRFDFINALFGILPDRSIPVLRDREDVAYIQAQSVYCIG